MGSRVGQFLGKLFSGPAGKNETILRAYGKLPFYAEYRRLEVSPGTPTAFSQWMDEGRLAWAKATVGGTPGSVQSSRILIHWPGTREIVVASLWDSRDSLGRIFPFTLFVVCPADALGGDPLERWTAATAIHEELDAAHAGLAALGRGGSDFYRMYQKRAITLRPDNLDQRVKQFYEQAGRISAADWFAAAGLDDTDAGTWFASLSRRIERWRAESALTGELALSCPLARGTPHHIQALLWLGLIAPFSRHAGKDPSLVVPMEHASGPTALHVLTRDPLADDFQLLTTDTSHYHYVEQLGRLPATADDAPPTANGGAPEGSLLSWLTKQASVGN
ncbi:MAG: DUF2094 domain-containing protein [Planctomycetes bacterium]|nr:DUF2094 domain-containing protein [Planctomycetota bacterium]